MIDTINEETKEKMSGSIESLKRSFQKIRTGRATPDLLDGISIDYYGTPTPLAQVGNISVPEARMLVLQPWDKGVLGDIEKAIYAADIGLTPQNDGNIIRLNIPALTEDKRKDLVKESKQAGENTKVAIRNIRRDANNDLKKAEKDKEITEDDLKDALDQIQKITDEFVKTVDELCKVKEKDIMEI